MFYGKRSTVKGIESARLKSKGALYTPLKNNLLNVSKKAVGHKIQH
jgi:hypothetical protein